ncbi:hypothetical protein SAMN04488051_11372 [Alkalimonas amylolytica]|uniref:Uncharacterized protein n=1 Tax=Alkalimonas amylolytica TaxID=152573 RepID=A0A1H4FXB9_ALKAM|nr:hypothetical protein SAMN04488051_11372 [Alkalimonas amylolytica]
MEINSIDDVNALNEYQKVKQIERIEKKIHRLSFVPASTCAGLIMWGFLSTWLNASWTPMNLLNSGSDQNLRSQNFGVVKFRGQIKIYDLVVLHRKGFNTER